MNTTLSLPHRHETAPTHRWMAPPRWDALVARSRDRLPALSRAVVAEVLQGRGEDGLDGNDRLRRLIGTLVQAYTVGIFSSREIESDGLGRQNWVGEPEPAPSANELQRVRANHRDLLTRCLARVYALAWKCSGPPALKSVCPADLPSEPEGGSPARDDYWHHALTEARNRIEWAYLADQVKRD